MATVVNMHQAKTELSRLVERALAGEEVVLARAGKPVVRLVPIRPERKPGRFKGQFIVGPNFDAPLPDEILREFYGPIEPPEDR